MTSGSKWKLWNSALAITKPSLTDVESMASHLWRWNICRIISFPGWQPRGCGLGSKYICNVRINWLTRIAQDYCITATPYISLVFLSWVMQWAMHLGSWQLQARPHSAVAPKWNRAGKQICWKEVEKYMHRPALIVRGLFWDDPGLLQLRLWNHKMIIKNVIAGPLTVVPFHRARFTKLLDAR